MNSQEYPSLKKGISYLSTSYVLKAPNCAGADGHEKVQIRYLQKAPTAMVFSETT